MVMKSTRPPWTAHMLGIVLIALGSAEGKQCVTQNACSCVFDDGSGTVDLGSVGNKNGTPRFHDYTSFDSFLYSYNPCYDFTDGSCVNVAVCQTDYYKTMFYNLGTQDTAEWSYDGTNLQIYYYAETDTMRETFVTAKCDPAYKEPFVAVTGEQPIGTPQYYVEIRTECACPNTCKQSTHTEVTISLSGGTVLLILVLAGSFLYIAIGMGIMRTRYQATGIEMFPNRTLWGALPGLIKDGVVFTYGCITGKSKRGSYEEV